MDLEIFDKIDKPDIALDELILLTFYLVDKPMSKLTFRKKVPLVYNLLVGYNLKVTDPDCESFSSIVNKLLNGLEFTGYTTKDSRFYFISPRYRLTEKGRGC